MNGRPRRQELRPPMDYVYGLDAAINAGAVKAGQAFKYAQIAHAGYKLGKKFYDTLKRPRSTSDSFSQNEKNMARPRRTSTPTPRSRSNTDAMSVVYGTPRTPAKRMFKGGATYRRLVAGGAKLSPGFWKTSGKRKSYRTAGASSSRSAGKLKKARGKKNIFDLYARKGAILNIERGGNVVTTALNPGNVLMGHATASRDQLFNVFGYSMAKYVAGLLKRDVVSFDELVIPAGVSVRNETLDIIYKTSPGGAEQRNINVVTGATTKWQDLGNFFVNLLSTQLTAQSGFQFIKIEYYSESVATTPAVNRELMFTKNMEKCRIHYHVKSNMKIQNRTVNIAANNDADDVDNVPLYGKQYESGKNYFLFDETRLVVDVNANYGQIVSGLLLKPPVLSAVKSAYAMSSVHLDPGQIKTSVLTWTKSFAINDLIRSLFIAGFESGSAYAMSVGKSRWFLLEKMIQAVATTDVNGIKVAFEVDTKFCGYITCPQAKVTTAIVSISPA